jgi:hypothetical protein
MNEVQVYQEPMTAAKIKAQVQLIQEVMKAVMEKDVHYGVIPGTPKPTLYKPGSEKLLSTFRIGVEPETEDLSTADEVHYRVKAKGFSQVTGEPLGFGIGECSSNEEKFKWRKPVCDEEFNETPEDRKRLVWKRGSNGNYQQKQVRMNPADVANTILKMAKKRAQIDLTLTVTAASDIFDQDLEDLPEGVRQEVADKKPPLKKPEKKDDKKKGDEQAVTVKVNEISFKDGEKDGKAYRIYSIVDENGEKYGTFSETFADLATTAQKEGTPVKITFTVGKFGKGITNLTVESDADNS